MKCLSPYLMFNGNCEEAVNFYIGCFGGEVLSMMRYSDSKGEMDVPDEHKNKIMHAHFSFNNNTLMASDDIMSADFTTAQEGTNVHLSLSYEDLDVMEKDFNNLSRKGKVTMALQDTFWGDRFGMIKDDFGMHWMFSCTINKK